MRAVAGIAVQVIRDVGQRLAFAVEPCRTRMQVIVADKPWPGKYRMLVVFADFHKCSEVFTISMIIPVCKNPVGGVVIVVIAFFQIRGVAVYVDSLAFVQAHQVIIHQFECAQCTMVQPQCLGIY